MPQHTTIHNINPHSRFSSCITLLSCSCTIGLTNPITSLKMAVVSFGHIKRSRRLIIIH